MKKFFMFLCVVIMFFGIVGCPSSDESAITLSQKSYSAPVTTSVADSDIGGTPVPEPATLILLGTGLVGLAGFGRKRFKK